MSPRQLARFFLLLLGALAAFPSNAAEMPKRKAGLWEIRSQMEGMPSGPPMQMCVDPSSDNLIQQQSKEKSDCGAPDIKKTGSSTTVHTVCRSEGSTMTVDAVYTGSFDSGYKSDVKMHYAPPQHGMSDAHMIQETKWLGACKPGQKPGDVLMHHGSFNMNDMMKDPRVQEMMKHQQSGE